MQSYIELEKLRYEKGTVIEMKVEGKVSGQTIIPLMLIQFVENAFKHGMKEKMCIRDSNAARAHLKGEVKITTGLGFLNSVIIDSHFEKRGRFGRLAQAVASNPGCIGIGLGEDTGMLITEGNKMEAIGSGLVVIIDGHDILHSNIADIPDGNPISIENLKVHFCEKGNGYLIKERKYLPEASDGSVIKKQVDVE